MEEFTDKIAEFMNELFDTINSIYDCIMESIKCTVDYCFQYLNILHSINKPKEKLNILEFDSLIDYGRNNSI